MPKLRESLLASAVFGLMAAAPGFSADLSQYRNFQLGTDLATVAKQAGASVSQVKVVHSRPALIQELAWRPQSQAGTAKPEAAQGVIFGFYEGKLFRIVVNYDRYEIEGMTADDIVESISATYGVATKPLAAVKVTQGPYGDQEQVLAQWQDEQYRFELIRSSYGPSFRLVGVVKAADKSVQAAIVEATRLDAQDAPQREAARRASEEDAVKTSLEKARLLNKPRFRP